jgi:alanyl-tRNA synthetase
LPLINEVEKYSDKKYDINNYFIENFEQKEINHCFRVIADHMRAVVFAMSDGAIASNNGRGSIIRKLIRRSMVCCKKLNISDCNILISVAQKVSEIMKDYYSYLLNEIDNVCEILRKEIDLFNKTLEKGYKLFSDAINNKVKLDGEVIFKLVDTFGFPFDTIKDLASQKNIEVDEVGFNKKLELHKEISRANLEIKGMSKQAEGLINFTKESSFLYDETEIDNVQVIGLFDENFDAIESFNNEG